MPRSKNKMGPTMSRSALPTCNESSIGTCEIVVACIQLSGTVILLNREKYWKGKQGSWNTLEWGTNKQIVQLVERGREGFVGLRSTWRSFSKYLDKHCLSIFANTVFLFLQQHFVWRGRQETYETQVGDLEFKDADDCAEYVVFLQRNGGDKAEWSNW